MPLIATRGAASAQGFGEFAQTAVATYIEDVFSTYLYTGTAATLTITNGIDLSGEGGLVWSKKRGVASDHGLTDSARGISKQLATNSTAAETTQANDITSFNSDGFTIGSGSFFNSSGQTNVTWTFRKAEKFFDVVTYTGDGTNNRLIAHNLGSTPGCVIVKNTSGSSTNWCVWHRSLSSTNRGLFLNKTDSEGNNLSFSSNQTPMSSTNFVVSAYTVTAENTNTNGATYVAYLFAHDAGGFGLTGSDNVISCGSFTSSGSGTATITLGYEPQWFLFKSSSAAGDWQIIDNMRGWSMGSQQILKPNSSAAEELNIRGPITPTGINITDAGAVSTTFIYIAIRRGPMKTPTSGTSVFTPIAATGSTGTSRSVGFTADLVIGSTRTGGDQNKTVEDRLRGFANSNAIGASPQLVTNSTNAESTASYPIVYNVWNTTRLDGQYLNNLSSVWWHFGRAPGFFDVVCYTGTGVTNRTVTHNLGIAPQLLFVKSRSNTQNWGALCTLNGGLQGRLNTTDALSAPSAAVWGNGSVYVAPTSTVFTVGTDNETNASGWTYVAYLFASVSGVSKVGSYTGTGTTKQIDCGFTNGSRFVLIKRTDSTGDWYVWDSARGIVAGNDPYLLLNSTAAEVTNTDYVDTYSAGFEISSTAPAAINANGGTFIFLAIA